MSPKERALQIANKLTGESAHYMRGWVEDQITAAIDEALAGVAKDVLSLELVSDAMYEPLFREVAYRIDRRRRDLRVEIDRRIAEIKAGQ